MASERELVELEIAAFMGPHIKRARLLLAALGVLYIIDGWRWYSAVSEVREQLGRFGDDPRLANLAHAVTLAQVLSFGTLAAGVADLGLAAIAGKRTMVAFYAAVAIFVAQTLVQMYASQGVFFVSLEWWLAAIILGMGFMAARKAERLRAGVPAVA